MENDITSTDTIFALATPPAKSGVAIIRISGKGALAALEKLSGRSGWHPQQARLCALRHPQGGALLDRALCLYFRAPHSFTGEDVAELHIHGSLALIRELQEALSAMEGLRHAQAGEFTRRAFLNNKMDLVEAEGLADLIDAETPRQREQALRQMGGELSSHFEGLRSRTLKALAHLEAYIDFPDEEIPESVIEELGRELEELKSFISNMLNDNRRGERLREGFRIAILGAPNAGKSSILNYLAGREAAIVSHKAGTTRDVIEIHMNINGFPVTLLDTAGLRETTDDIEEEGVRRALECASTADLKLFVHDASSGRRDKALEALLDANTIILNNKIDISAPSGEGIGISAKTGQGMDQLLSAIGERLSRDFTDASAPLITRHRHRAQLQEALSHLNRVDMAAPLELTCEELRRAALAVGKITGKIAVDDVLGVIFSEFCIGK